MDESPNYIAFKTEVKLEYLDVIAKDLTNISQEIREKLEKGLYVEPYEISDNIFGGRLWEYGNHQFDYLIYIQYPKILTDNWAHSQYIKKLYSNLSEHFNWETIHYIASKHFSNTARLNDPGEHYTGLGPFYVLAVTDYSYYSNYEPDDGYELEEEYASYGNLKRLIGIFKKASVSY